MSSLIPVHTPAAKNGRHIVFPYKTQGLSFSVKPLRVCSPPIRDGGILEMAQMPMIFSVLSRYCTLGESLKMLGRVFSF